MKFLDTAGREWLIRIDVNALRRVRDATGCNFGKWDCIPELLVRLHFDDLIVCEIARWILDPDLKDRKVDPDDFLASMRGDCIEKACQAIEDGLQSFFRNAAVRKEVAAMIQNLNVSMSGDSSTRSQAASGSIPEPSHSLNL